jgi:hypothetical protein
MADGYTVLRVTERFTIPLLARHAARLGAGSASALEHFRSFVVDPGVYRVRWDGRQLSTLVLPGSRLSDDVNVTWAVSPFAREQGRFTKPAAPSAYDSVRAEGAVTMLTTADGEELLEADTAALFAWNGVSLVAPPLDRPAVASLAEAAIATHEPVVRAPITRAGAWPLLLVNAVRTAAPTVEGRPPFPADVRARLEQLLSREDA